MFGSKCLLIAALLLSLSVPPLVCDAIGQAGRVSDSKADQPNLANAPLVYDNVHFSIRFENDGTGTTDVQVKLHVQTALGLMQAGQRVFNYSADNERQDVSFVRVLKQDGRTIVAGPEAVQDLSAPVSQAAPMYSDIRQKHITVPGLAVGDTLEYEVRTTVVRPLVAGQFWQTLNLDMDGPCLDEQVDLNIPRERLLKMKSPDDVSPSVRDEADRRIYHWQTSFHPKAAAPIAKASARMDATQSLMGPVLPLPRQLLFTTFQTWAELGKWYGGLERDRRTITPELRSRADEIVRGVTTDLAKAEALYAFVSRNIRYVSLSFGIGRFQPHTAADVLTNQYGDCKDKATLLEALLEVEGLHASSALVSTGLDVDPDVPSPQQFDHMILFMSIDGKNIWMDSTSGLAEFGYLLPELRGKNAVVVDSGTAQLVKTVNAPPKVSYKVDLDATLKDSKVDASLTVELRGDAEFLARSAALSLPIDSLNSALESAIKTEDKMQGASVRITKLGDPQDTSLPFLAQLRFSVPVSSTASAPNGSANGDPLGLSFLQDSLGLSLPDLPASETERHKPLSLGFPRDIRFHVHFNGPFGVDRAQPIHLSRVSKDFAEFETTDSQDPQGVTVDWHLSVLKTEVPPEQFEEYASLRKELVKSISILETPAAAPVVSSNVTPASTPLELHRAGLAEFNNKNYNKARQYFEAAVAANPKYDAAWNNLGRSYLNLGNLDKAASAFEKAIEINPNQSAAFNNLGLVYRRQRAYDKAIEFFKKAIEVQPDDQIAHSNLGQVYLIQGRYGEAVPEFQTAAVITPKSASVQLYLGRAYLKVGETEKATKALDRALDLDSTPTMQNDVAYELGNSKVQLDRAESLAKSAVSSVGSQLRTISIDAIHTSDISNVVSLEHYWDTLGWIKFQQGDLAVAEKYLSAAWAMGDDGVIGDHLAQLYERQNRKAEAIKTYSLALAGAAAPLETQQRLATLLGDARQVDNAVTKVRSELTQRRVSKLKRVPVESAKAEFWVLSSPAGRAQEVRFISGDEKLRNAASDIQAIPLATPLPTEDDIQILRRGMLSCSTVARECLFALVPVEGVRSAN
jgi:tetratricopeptide (TPR) repeat protein